jgi:hypothetical protein
VLSQDVGRNVCRTLLIDCEKGVVGVSYAESSPAPSVFFLISGSARNRLPGTQAEERVLILSTNEAQKLLCRQAVEEYSSWEAITVDSTRLSEIEKKVRRDLSWVILFEDWPNAEAVFPWIARFQEKNPALKVGWSGKKAPVFLKRLKQVTVFPPLESDTVVEFKEKMSEASGVFSGMEDSVVAFKKKKRRASKSR